MVWCHRRTWHPDLNVNTCTNCGRCYAVCPQSPECLSSYTNAAISDGQRFGLAEFDNYFISYDIDPTKRILSASGGALSALLGHLLETNVVDGIVASLPVFAEIGNPHYQVHIFRAQQELERGRSSHYHPLNYESAIREIRDSEGSFVLLGVPCIMRGVKRLSVTIQKKIKFNISLSCSHNVTGAFVDCLAEKEGIKKEEVFLANLREKSGIPDANNFNTYFKLEQREIRKNRFESAFTEMWRNYFFAQECCLYCPDFYGVDADMSVKDAWGRLSSDPLGTSLLVVKNKVLAEHLVHLRSIGKLYLEKCDADEIVDSQRPTAYFKHVGVLDRILWKKVIRNELKRSGSSHRSYKRRVSADAIEFWRLRLLIFLSNIFYFKFGLVPVSKLLFLSRLWENSMKLYGKISAGILKLRAALPFSSAKYQRTQSALRVLIAGGYGYGNIGDEAQLAANLQHWRKALPASELTVLTPDPEYTSKTHRNIKVELATRISLFGNGVTTYFGSEKLFKKRYFYLVPLYLFNACLMKAGLPTIGLTEGQVRTLETVYKSDVLFLSGGGYLTGMTLTRLWDNMLLIRLAHVFGVPVLLSGQTIGVFKDPISRNLARWGLRPAEFIYVRDPIDSVKDLASIGISGEKVKSTFDDALFYQAESHEKIAAFLALNNILSPYLAVNVHYWGQVEENSRVIMRQIAVALDSIQSKYGLQVVFVPMHKSDEQAIAEVVSLMQTPAISPGHDIYDVDIIVGMIQNARLCLTMKHHPIIFAMAAGVPTLSMTFDEYYWHKNFGAHKIFGQEEFVISGETHNLSGQIEKGIDKIFNERDAISEQIKSRIETLRPLAGEVIYKFKSLKNSV
jgi:polysaccharide pyruvyl transferase WcaK-like protein/coenzyme F420-reducing hydrogenase beta subunit